MDPLIVEVEPSDVGMSTAAALAFAGSSSFWSTVAFHEELVRVQGIRINDKPLGKLLQAHGYSSQDGAARAMGLNA